MINLLSDFPDEVRPDISSIRENNGVLSAQKCQHICELLSIEIESLMVALLPIAASYSKAPISSFLVGAVARGLNTDCEGYSNLYLGANYEFENQALCHSLHAEQAAISNAWLNDEPSVTSIATSAAPCGHCRQFLYEVSGNKPFPILMPKSFLLSPEAIGISKCQDQDHKDKKSKNNFEKNCHSINLATLLPAAFGPMDLGCERLLMEPGFGSNKLHLVNESDDELINSALKAANLCYAPYTENFVGCALQMNHGEIFIGRYAENAAHNPSLSAFTAALSHMIMGNANNTPENIARVVMVEQASKSCQKDATSILLAALNDRIKLEYHMATTFAH
jgi:cytidine deaminase